jgi:hypothetical protein
VAELRPDREALLRWLVSPQVVRPNGEVMAWHGAEAFGYPEAGGLLLRLLARERDAKGCADAIASWLAVAVHDQRIGRGDRRYTFDLGAVAAGLAAHLERNGCIEHLALARRDALHEVAAAIEARCAVDREPHERWSDRFGPHMRKIGHFLRCADILGDVAVPACEQLWLATGAKAFDPRAATPGASATYLHACLYALEGTLVLAARPGDDDCVDEASAWLARLQRSHGGLPAWADGERGFGPTRADTTAQAVRLWARLDRPRYADAIARGLDWLARAAVPGGGVRYSDDCDHENTWATVFTIQAIDFAEGRVDREGLL